MNASDFKPNLLKSEWAAVELVEANLERGEALERLSRVNDQVSKAANNLNAARIEYQRCVDLVNGRGASAPIVNKKNQANLVNAKTELDRHRAYYSVAREDAKRCSDIFHEHETECVRLGAILQAFRHEEELKLVENLTRRLTAQLQNESTI